MVEEGIGEIHIIFQETGNVRILSNGDHSRWWKRRRRLSTWCSSWWWWLDGKLIQGMEGRFQGLEEGYHGRLVEFIEIMKRRRCGGCYVPP